MTVKFLLGVFLVLLSAIQGGAQIVQFSGHAPSGITTWKPINIGAGGYVTGISFSTSGLTKIVRCDTYGAYIWDSGPSIWRQLISTDTLPSGFSFDGSWGGGPYEIVAVPNADNTIYMLLMGQLLVSNDAGHTFFLTNFPAISPHTAGSNAGVVFPFRYNGKHIAVDPANANIIYIGTPEAGLWKGVFSSPSNAVWTQITAVPPALPNGAVTQSLTTSAAAGSGATLTFTSVTAVSNGWYVYNKTHPLTIPGGTTVAGTTGTTVTLSAAVINGGVSSGDVIQFVNIAADAVQQPGYTVSFDPSSTVVGGVTQGIAVSAWGSVVYKSTDGGSTWTATTGGPTTNRHMAYSPSGVLWQVAYPTDPLVTAGQSNLFKFSAGTWTQYTLVQTQGQANLHTVAINPANSANVIAGDEGGLLNITTNSGGAWTGPLNGTVNFPVGAGTRVASDIPWLAVTNEIFMSSGDMAFDPSTTNKLFFTEGIGVWWSNPPTTVAAFNWNSQNNGIEQLVARTAASSPNSNTPVLSSGDRPFWYTSNLVTYPSVPLPNAQQSISDGWMVSWVSSSPDAFVGLSTWLGRSNSGISLDDGQTWTLFATNPYENLTVTTAPTPAGNPTIHATSYPATVYTGMGASDRGFLLTTSAQTLTSSNALHFATAPPASIVGRAPVAIADPTPGTGVLKIIQGTTVSSISGNDAILSANVTGVVPTGTVIAFPPANDPVANLAVASVGVGTITLNGNVVSPGVLQGETLAFNGNAGGSIAAATTSNIIIMPQNQSPYVWYTKDGGATWKNAIFNTSAPGFNADGSAVNIGGGIGTGFGFFYYAPIHGVAADRVDGTLYLYNARPAADGGGLYTSTDGGDTWTLKKGDIIAGMNTAAGQDIQAVPSNAGHLFATAGIFIGAPLARSVDHGATWTNVTGVIAYNFGFGAPKPGGTGYPSVFVDGMANGVRGIYRFDDFTTNPAVQPTPVFISVVANKSFDALACIEGDKKVWGMVYTCHGGSGWAVGTLNFLLKRDLDPAANDNSPLGLSAVA